MNARLFIYDPNIKVEDTKNRVSLVCHLHTTPGEFTPGEEQKIVDELYSILYAFMFSYNQKTIEKNNQQNTPLT